VQYYTAYILSIWDQFILYIPKTVKVHIDILQDM